MSKACVKIKDSWLGKWKEENDDWRNVIYRLGFPQTFLIEYSSPEEMTHFIDDLKSEIDYHKKNNPQHMWRYRSAASDMFRYFRKMIRNRHANSFAKDELYFVHSNIYGQHAGASKWKKGGWARINKNNVILFMQYNEAGEPEFLAEGTKMVIVTGAQLDKIRPVREQK